MSKPLITVFTPTYNRRHTLHKCYNSLLAQSNKSFVWLIVDDGSTDGTEDLVREWQCRENGFEIQYAYKENGGLHTGYNKAIELAETELMMCIDSDDYMTDDAVEIILSRWKAHQDSKYAGMVFLDITEDGNVIGTKMPDLKSATVYDLYNRLGVKGDKKQVYRPELMRPFHSPVFPGEKLFPTCYKYFQVDLTHEMLLFNEPVCVVEYMPDGYTKNIIKLYKKNLNNYIFYRKFIMTYPNATLWHRYRFAIHYVAESLLARDFRFVKNSPRKLLTLAATPGGLLLYVYLLVKG